MSQRPVSSPQQKALVINLDGATYGTFAEIGAGQEVARWFFRAGGAAGTIAKSMSAYDMVVSDAIYGPTERYVSRQRLQKMLDHEYGLLLDRLATRRGESTRFFAFADTVAARSYTRQDEAHGWMGVRFQAVPGAVPSQIIIHVRMLDSENVLQQESLGVVGVNLLYAALYDSGSPDRILAGLLDNLTRDRVEVDMIKLDGPAFGGLDNRLMSLRLVEQGLTESAMFTAPGEVVQAAEVLYRRPILAVRGSFRPVTNATLDLIECARRQFARELGLAAEEICVLTEMTLRHLAEGGVIDHRDFLDRADTLGALDLPVMVSNHARYFRLAAYLLGQTRHRVALAMGVRRLQEMFEEKYYTDLEGGILEACGRMFKNDLRLYIYPTREGAGAWVTSHTLTVEPGLRHLYAHIGEHGYIADLVGFREEHLAISARDVLARLRAADPTWESAVPAQVVGLVKERRLFGYGSAG